MTSEEPEHEWSTQWLRAFLTEKKVIKPRVTWVLSDKALSALATNILIRSEFHGRPMAHNEATEAFLDEEDQHRATALRKGLERRRAAATLQLAGWKDHPTPGDPHVRMQLQRVNETINKIAAAISTLDDITPTLKPIFIWPRNVTYTTWRDHAVELAHYFGRWLKECNPGYQPGISNDGPVVGYVWAVVPLITGKEEERGTVFRYLERHTVDRWIKAHPKSKIV